MDLAVGVPNIFIAMNQLTNKGEPKIVNRCVAPLTARGCVKRIFTDIAVIDVERDGLVLRELLPGLTPDDIRKTTDAPLKVAANYREINVPPTFKGIQLHS